MSKQDPVALGKKQRDVLVNQARDELNRSGETLDMIAGSCCMPDRSTRMRAARASLERSITTLEGKEDFVEVQDALATFGGHIGQMYVTCCTPTREVLYRKLLGQLNRSHELLSQAGGQGH